MADKLEKYDIDMVLPPQMGMAAKGLGMLLGSLTGCSGERPTMAGMEDEEGSKKAGDQVCYQQGGTPIMITLLEDVKPGQMTARAQKADGKQFMADTNYFQDSEYCMEGDDD